MPITRRHASLAVASALALPVLAALPRPTGRVILSLKGRLGAGHGPSVDFDDAMLAAMPQHTLRTQTPWHEGVKAFTGPLLRDVLAAAGAQGSTIRAVEESHDPNPMRSNSPGRNRAGALGRMASAGGRDVAARTPERAPTAAAASEIKTAKAISRGLKR